MGQILEFCELLKKKRQISQGEIEDNEDKIEFQNVDIEAPGKQKKIYNINFNRLKP